MGGDPTCPLCHGTGAIERGAPRDPGEAIASHLAAGVLRVRPAVGGGEPGPPGVVHAVTPCPACMPRLGRRALAVLAAGYGLVGVLLAALQFCGPGLQQEETPGRAGPGASVER